jgi:hypothetical protein
MLGQKFGQPQPRLAPGARFGDCLTRQSDRAFDVAARGEECGRVVQSPLLFLLARRAGGELALRATQAGATFANIVLDGTADIDVRGTWVNDAPALGTSASSSLAALWIDGGTVTLDARGDLDVRRGSTIDVEDGAGDYERRTDR